VNEIPVIRTTKYDLIRQGLKSNLGQATSNNRLKGYDY
jgi:hypothetical protein